LWANQRGQPHPRNQSVFSSCSSSLLRNIDSRSCCASLASSSVPICNRAAVAGSSIADRSQLDLFPQQFVSVASSIRQLPPRFRLIEDHRWRKRDRSLRVLPPLLHFVFRKCCRIISQLQVVQSHCGQKYPRSGGARKSNAQDLLGRGTTSASICDTGSASYRETIVLQTSFRILW
jgi:hypothetical protein